MPQLPGETAKTAGSREAKSVTPTPTMSVTSGLSSSGPLRNALLDSIDVEHHGASAAALIYCSLNPRGVELLLVGGSKGAATGLQLGVQRSAKLGEGRLNHVARVLRGQAGGNPEHYGKNRGEAASHARDSFWLSHCNNTLKHSAL